MHVQTKASVDSSETSTKLLECRLILTRSSFTGQDPLSCRRVSLLCGVDRFCPSSPRSTTHFDLFCPTPFFSRVPFRLPVTRDLQSKTLCLVSRQNRQRNRLLSVPPYVVLQIRTSTAVEIWWQLLRKGRQTTYSATQFIYNNNNNNNNKQGFTPNGTNNEYAWVHKRVQCSDRW